MKLRYSFKSIALIGLVSLGLASCKKNNYVLDQDPLVPPARAEIAYNQGSQFSRDFFVENTPAGSVFAIPVGITDVSNVARTIKFNYSSPTAVAGTHYTAPATVVIPAGQSLDTLRVTANFANIAAGVAHVLKVKIASDSEVPAFAGKDSVVLTMRRFCPVVDPVNTIGGAYTNTFEGTYGPYTSSVINFVLTSATTATARITNIYDSNIEANVKFDWTDKTNFKVTMDPQQTQYTSGGLPLFVRLQANTTSSFSACNQTITMRFQLYTSAAVVDTWVSAMAR